MLKQQRKKNCTPCECVEWVTNTLVHRHTFLCSTHRPLSALVQLRPSTNASRELCFCWVCVPFLLCPMSTALNAFQHSVCTTNIGFYRHVWQINACFRQRKSLQFASVVRFLDVVVLYSYASSGRTAWENFQQRPSTSINRSCCSSGTIWSSWSTLFFFCYYLFCHWLVGRFQCVRLSCFCVLCIRFICPAFAFSAPGFFGLQFLLFCTVFRTEYACVACFCGNYHFCTVSICKVCISNKTLPRSHCRKSEISGWKS